MRLSSAAMLVSTVILASPAAGQEWTGRARLDGRVVDDSGAPLAGATVSARHLTRQGGGQPTRPALADPGSPASNADIRAALEEGRVDRTRRLLDSVDADAPAEAGVLVEIGQRLLTAGETEEAVTFFGRALDRDPDHVDAHYGRALGLLALGRPEEARRDFEAIVALRPESVVAEKASLAIQQLAPAPAPPGSSSPRQSGTAE